MSEALPERPASFDFAMEFLGDPEAAELRRYVEALEGYARQAVLLERERCAQVCDGMGGNIDPRDPDESRLTANSLAAAIRAGTER